MPLLSSTELLSLIESGVIDALTENVNAASIDVRLGDEILLEREMCLNAWEKPSEEDLSPYVVDLSQKGSLNFDKFVIPEEGITIYPSQFFLASTIETFNLPDNISCQFMLKSSIARAGLQHLMAGWCDAGWHNSTLTLELKNVTGYHALVLRKGMKIGQMLFHRHAPVPTSHSYATKGRYNNQTKVQASKGAV